MRTLRIALVASVALVTGIVASADAQTPFLTLDTPNPETWANFGLSVALGDVNNDGNADIAVGAPQEDVAVNEGAGRAYVFSGADGSLLLTLNSPNPQQDGAFGLSVAVGDANGDGKGDIVVGAYFEDVAGNENQGRAYVFSGADGSLLYTLDSPNPQTGGRFGTSVAVGDVNGDGKADIAVGAYYESVGRAYVFSGADGSLLLTLESPNPGSAFFGRPVAVGDVNGDGTRDIAVGATGERVGWDDGAGRAYVFSGADGSLLLTLDSPNPQAYADFGLGVAVGDVNGDGRGDIAVGAHLEDVNSTAAQGRAYVFSGLDGSLLLTLDGPNPQENLHFGWSLAVGDANGDDKADIAVGASQEDVGVNDDQGRAYVFSGADGSLLLTLDSPNPQATAGFGEGVAVGDVNGDGRGDIAVGASREDVGANQIQGRVYVFPGAPAPTLVPVGGTAELPDVAKSHSSTRSFITLAGLAAGALLALAAGAWFARRRWLR